MRGRDRDADDATWTDPGGMGAPAGILPTPGGDGGMGPPLADRSVPAAPDESGGGMGNPAPDDGQASAFGVPVAFATPSNADRVLAAMSTPGATSGIAAHTWQALTDIGAAILAGRSPNALANIGAGISQGLHEYRLARQSADALSARVAQARAQLQAMTKYPEDQLANQQQRTQDYERHLGVMEGQGNQRLGIEAGTLGEREAHDAALLDIAKKRLALDQASIGARAAAVMPLSVKQTNEGANLAARLMLTNPALTPERADAHAGQLLHEAPASGVPASLPTAPRQRPTVPRDSDGVR